MDLVMPKDKNPYRIINVGTRSSRIREYDFEKSKNVRMINHSIALIINKLVWSNIE